MKPSELEFEHLPSSSSSCTHPHREHTRRRSMLTTQEAQLQIRDGIMHGRSIQLWHYVNRKSNQSRLSNTWTFDRQDMHRMMLPQFITLLQPAPLTPQWFVYRLLYHICRQHTGEFMRFIKMDIPHYHSGKFGTRTTCLLPLPSIKKSLLLTERSGAVIRSPSHNSIT